MCNRCLCAIHVVYAFGFVNEFVAHPKEYACRFVHNTFVSLKTIAIAHPGIIATFRVFECRSSGCFVSMHPESYAAAK
jgi:hypothetical protein